MESGGATVLSDEAPDGGFNRAAEVYRTYPAPMVVYNRHAVIEAADHSRDSVFWQALFTSLEKVTCYYGLIHDNATVSLGAAAGDDTEPNIENRSPNYDQCGP